MMPVGPKLTLLFVVGALLLSFPILAIFNRPVLLGGIPVLYLYLFGVWIAGIAAVFLVVRTPDAGDPRVAPAPPGDAEEAQDREHRRC
ncbi:MAG TPA: hypothetical protein VLD61_05915 [Methylomirabilota bacterium]|nr:hypothetical protein [Methylomirabilota bacterium]